MTELDITELFEEVVRNLSKEEGFEVLYENRKGKTEVIKSPTVNYIFGNAQYIKEVLDKYSKAQFENKLPLIALFTPIHEERGDKDYFSKTKVSIVIACSTRRDWSNEERRIKSFRNVLRPIYKRLLEVLLEDNRFEWDYDEVKHSYSENYSYGRYGAYTDSGDEVSEPIDAINIRSMEIKINKPNCKRR